MNNGKTFIFTTYIKEVILLFKEKSLKEILFGKKVQHTRDEKELLMWIKKNNQESKELDYIN